MPPSQLSVVEPAEVTDAVMFTERPGHTPLLVAVAVFAIVKVGRPVTTLIVIETVAAVQVDDFCAFRVITVVVVGAKVSVGAVEPLLQL